MDWTEVPPDTEFSLVCQHCDAGMEISTYEEALVAGWIEIDYAPDLPMANFLGVCPVCQAWLNEP